MAIFVIIKTKNMNQKKRILIIHGLESNAGEHWFLEEKERLEKLGHTVVVPNMPNTNHPKKEQWIKIIEDFDPGDDNAVLVGHSLGGTAILRYLEKIDVKIKRCILIAAPIRDVGLEKIDNFLEPDFDWDKIKQNCDKIIIFNQTNDPYVPMSHGEDLANNVDGHLIKIEGNNHFNIMDLSMLEKYILG